jgi:phage shock protein C
MDMSTQIKRLYRPTNNRMLGGVCAGIGEYLEIDPTLVRVGFAVASILGWLPAIFLAYLFMWIFVPDETKVAADMAPSQPAA